MPLGRRFWWILGEKRLLSRTRSSVSCRVLSCCSSVRRPRIGVQVRGDDILRILLIAYHILHSLPFVVHQLSQRLSNKNLRIRKKKRNYETLIPAFFLRPTTPPVLYNYVLMWCLLGMIVVFLLMLSDHPLFLHTILSLTDPLIAEGVKVYVVYLG